MSQSKPRSFAIFGLGRFGTSIVDTLAAHDVEILAVDRDLNKVEAVADQVDQAVAGDVSDSEFLRRIALEHFDVVVFAMGEDFESSVMGTMLAQEMGCKRIIVKALDPRQAAILTKLGADQVVLPEVEMGAKIASHLLNPNVLAALDQVNGVRIAEQHPDAAWVGQTLAGADIRRTAGIEVLALIRDGHTHLPVSAQTKLLATDVLVTMENPLKS